MDESALELFAEMSIGLVGFAGVVSVLGRSRLTTATRSFRIRALLINGVTSLCFSILPIILAGYYQLANDLWPVATILLVLSQASMMIWAVRAVGPLTEQEVPNSIRRTMFSLMTIAILYQSYGVAFDPDSLASIYLVGLSASFGLGLFHFCVLVVSTQSSMDT